MWIIQSDTLMELPDDLLLPPNSTKIEVPPSLFTSPRDFHVENGALVNNGKPVPTGPIFTLDEIALLKQLVATTAINAGEGKENK
jgi:hypothetical protein